jgi:hypothetical protein
MENSYRAKVADLLLQLLEGSVTDDEFRTRLRLETEGQTDPIVGIAEDEAEDYLRAFQRLSLFRRRPIPPDPDEVASRADSLRVVARALREGWSVKQLTKTLRWT